MCIRNQCLCLHYWHPLFLSSPVNFSSSPAVPFKLSLFSCSVSFASNSSLYNSALNYAITEFRIFRKQEINSFSMPSGTLMDCCKILHFVMLQRSSGVKSAKFKTVFTRPVRPGFTFKKSFICSLYPANIIMGFLMFGFKLLFLWAISVSTASFPKSRLEGEHKVYASSTNKTHPSAFLMIFAVLLAVPPICSANRSLRCTSTTFSLSVIPISLNISI